MFPWRLTVDLSTEIETRLIAEAAREGLKAEDFVQALINQRLKQHSRRRIVLTESEKAALDALDAELSPDFWKRYESLRTRLRSEPFLSESEQQVEHIEPISQGGADTAENLAWSCGGCNAYKAIATAGANSQTGERVPLYHPRRDSWNNHFVWSEDSSVVVPLTEKGRVTIERLKLNRPEVVSLRQLLIAAGQHPSR